MPPAVLPRARSLPTTLVTSLPGLAATSSSSFCTAILRNSSLAPGCEAGPLSLKMLLAKEKEEEVAGLGRDVTGAAGRGQGGRF